MLIKLTTGNVYNNYNPSYVVKFQLKWWNKMAPFLPYIKCLYLSAIRMVKLTPGVNFINILFAQIPKAQKDWQLDCIICAFGIYAFKSFE